MSGFVNNGSASNPVDLRALPYRTRLVAQKIGLEATYALFNTFAHKTLYIPGSLTRSNLADKIGKPQALALIELWPNTSITLPKIDKIFQQWRNHELLNELAQNTLTVTELCIKYDLTRQRINQIKNANNNGGGNSGGGNNTAKQNTCENLTLDLTL